MHSNIIDTVDTNDTYHENILNMYIKMLKNEKYHLWQEYLKFAYKVLSITFQYVL